MQKKAKKTFDGSYDSDCGVVEYAVGNWVYHDLPHRPMNFQMNQNPLWDYDLPHRLMSDDELVIDFMFRVKHKGSDKITKYTFKRVWTDQLRKKNIYPVKCTLYVDGKKYWRGKVSTIPSDIVMRDVLLGVLEPAGIELC